MEQSQNRSGPGMKMVRCTSIAGCVVERASEDCQNEKPAGELKQFASGSCERDNLETRLGRLREGALLALSATSITEQNETRRSRMIMRTDTMILIVRSSCGRYGDKISLMEIRNRYLNPI